MNSSVFTDFFKTIYGSRGAFTYIVNILNLIFWGFIFSRAGEGAWKIIIPFYNLYIQFKVSKKSKLFVPALIMYIIGTVTLFVCAFIILAAAFFSIFSDTAFPWDIFSPASWETSYITSIAIIFIIGGLCLIGYGILRIFLMIGLANAFGYSNVFAVGLIFLPTIFLGIVAFNKEHNYIFDQTFVPNNFYPNNGYEQNPQMQQPYQTNYYQYGQPNQPYQNNNQYGQPDQSSNYQYGQPNQNNYSQSGQNPYQPNYSQPGQNSSSDQQ